MKVTDLFPQLKRLEAQTKAAEIQESQPKNPPDSIVLCSLHITCKCGKIYESPNPYLLARYGKSIQLIKTWSNHFNSLPREHIVRKETSIACMSCFPGTNITHLDFQDSKHEVENGDL